jgi:ribosomal protein S18 acetylase RimI-like enzyme
MSSEYPIRPVVPDDLSQIVAMADIIADGRERAYGLVLGSKDYERLVTGQKDSEGLAELRNQVRAATSEDPKTGFWVAERLTDAMIVGLCIAQTHPAYVEMDRLFVAEDSEGQRIGTRLINEVIAYAGSLPILGEVLESNQRALDLYKRRGFEVTGKLETPEGLETDLEYVGIARKEAA